MNYADARVHINTGDLLAWSHYDWDSWYDLQVQAVRIGTASEYCHVGLAWVFAGRVWVIESVAPVVRVVPLSNLLEQGFYWLPIPPNMSGSELEFAFSKVGKGRYSKVQAVAAQLNLLDVGADDLWECAEFVIAARRLSGVDLGPKATPSAVVKRAQELGSACHFINP